MTAITYSDMPSELRDKLKLQETLNRILKNNGIVDIEALEGVVNELKTKLNTLINDVLGVEHSIDEIHNYDDTNIKAELKEITDQIQGVHTNINNITAKLNNITNTTTKLSLKNSSLVEINYVVNDNDDRSQAIIQPQYILLVNKNHTGTFYEGLNLGGASTESGSGIMSSNKVTITLLHKIEVTANQTNTSDVNGLVFSYTSNGVRINDFTNTNHVVIPWDS
jgi:seryl-tRNA synthetase